VALEWFLLLRSLAHISVITVLAIDAELQSWEPLAAVFALTGVVLYAAKARTSALWWAVCGSVAMNVAEFPWTANHGYLQSALLLLAALARTIPTQTERLPDLILWIRAAFSVVFFHTGWQKWAAGTFDQGEFIAAMTHSRKANFDWLFTILAPGDMERLRNLDPREAGTGPFRFTSPWALLATQGVMWAEMALPCLWWIPRLTTPLIILSILMVWSFQLAAAEVSFAILSTALALTWLKPRMAQWGLYALMVIDFCLTVYIHRNPTTWLN
jgi:hypothetical protein